jgi:hypothetical protein
MFLFVLRGLIPKNPPSLSRESGFLGNFRAVKKVLNPNATTL